VRNRPTLELLESRLSPSATSFSDQTLSYTQSTFTGSVAAGTTVAITGSRAYFEDRDLNLSFTGNFNQNHSGFNEKWLRGANNTFGNPWYFIKPDGELFAWDGTKAAQGSTLLTALDPVYWVYPDLLYNASPNTLNYVLEQKLNLKVNGSLSVNAFGRNEKWLAGNTNNYGNQWYFIDASGGLYSWDGTSGSATGTLLAQLDTLYWAQPQRLYNAQAGEVTAAINGTVLTVTTPTDWAGRVVVALDTTAPASEQVFTLNFVNQAPTLNTIPNQTASRSGSPLQITLSFSDADSDIANVSATETNVGVALKQTLGLRVQGSLHTNAFGQHEIWLQSTLNDWYFLKPDGTLTKWDGTSGQATGTLIRTLDPVFYYHPDLLTNPTAGNLAYALEQHLHLTNTGNLHVNYGGAGEQWLLGQDGWYFLKPSGQLYKWDGTPNAATGTLMATLNSIDASIQALTAATPTQTITPVINGNTLTINASATPVGEVALILITVADASQSAGTMFLVTVTA
jgi:hypothetical protein